MRTLEISSCKALWVLIVITLINGIPSLLNAQEILLKTNRPNVIFILLDDVGFSDLGCFGSEIETPNIDKLASMGLRFNNFNTRAVCSPTRASILTGRNNQTIGMIDIADVAQVNLSYSRGYLDPNAGTIAEILKMNGYRTTLSGKWHLTPPDKWNINAQDKSSWPISRGFDNFYGWLGGWTDQYNPIGKGREIIRGDKLAVESNPGEEHVSVALVDNAIKYLREGFADYPDRPEFLFLSLGAAHAPYQVPKRYIERYRGIYEEGWDKLRLSRYKKQKRLGIIPGNSILTERDSIDQSWDSLTPEEKVVYSRFMETYAGFLTHADEQIGRLIKYLKDVGQFDNSLIFLMSDNGAAPEAGMEGGFYNAYGDTTSIHTMFKDIDVLGTERSHPLYQRPWAWLGGTPFKRYKLWLNAGGVRDPLIVSWPNRIKEDGKIRGQFIDVTDVVPTVLDVLGIDLPRRINNLEQMEMHGSSFYSILIDSKSISRHKVQFFSLRGERAIYSDGWKAISHHVNGTSFDEDKWELYHVSKDYSEANDLSQKNPQKLEALIRLWWEEAEKYNSLPLKEFRIDFQGAEKAAYK